MSRLFAVCLSGLALVAILPSLTSAQIDPPHLKPGLWDDKVDMNGMQIGMQMCMDESVEARAAAFRAPTPGGGGAAAAAAQNCPQRDMKKIPGGFAIESTCIIRGHTTHTSMLVIGDFDSDYKMDIAIQPDSGKEMKMAMSARWTGPCPEGMKGGQVVTKMDMGGLAAAIAAAQARRGGAAAGGDGQ
jgi:hypothetical protein